MRPSKLSTERLALALRSGILNGRRVTDDTGTASLEFITAGLILLLPLVYLILTMSSVQAAALATEGAARQAARVFVRADTETEGRRAAEHAVRVGLADYGIDPGATEVGLVCSPDPDACLTRQGTVTVTVRVAVSLPLVPQALDVGVPGTVPIEGVAAQTVSRFWSGS